MSRSTSETIGELLSAEWAEGQGRQQTLIGHELSPTILRGGALLVMYMLIGACCGTQKE